MAGKRMVVLLLVLASGVSVTGAKGRVEVIVRPGPVEENKALSVDVLNQADETIWYCVAVIKTSLHDPSAEEGSPIPGFGVRFRRAENQRWANVLWGRDFGDLRVPERLRPGEKRTYGIWLDTPGYYRLELPFRDSEIQQEECGWELKRSQEARSRVFRVVPAAELTRPNNDAPGPFGVGRPIAQPQDENRLAFGQIYGSVGFLSGNGSETMTDASKTILAFASEGGFRHLILTDQAGDYIALLEPGRYCVGAFTRAGKELRLSEDQLKCVNVEDRQNVRLDVMLVPLGK